MNWLKKLLQRPLDNFKREADKAVLAAIAWVRSGGPKKRIVQELKEDLADLIAKAKLPSPIGPILVMIAMNQDWEAMLDKPEGDLVAELERMRTKIAGARL